MAWLTIGVVLVVGAGVVSLFGFAVELASRSRVAQVAFVYSGLGLLLGASIGVGVLWQLSSTFE